MAIKTDEDAWKAYPDHRLWFNKLWFAEEMGNLAGPCGVAPPESGFYIVRPIYNLSGMGVGARKVWIDKNDYTRVEPGYFWCEWYDGPLHSVTYVNNGEWEPISSWEGIRESESSLSKFVMWRKSSFLPPAPALADSLLDLKIINIEWIDRRPIEVHLRGSSDPHWADVIVPVWDPELTKNDGFIEDFDDADGFLDPPRLGFIVKHA